MLHADTERGTEFSGTAQELCGRLFGEFRGAQQNRFRYSGRSRDDVGAAVHSVDEENVQVPAFQVHRFHARCAPAAIGMRRGVGGAEIRLRFDDARAVPLIAETPGNPCADDRAGDLCGIEAEEIARKLPEPQCLRVKAEPGVRGAVFAHFSRCDVGPVFISVIHSLETTSEAGDYI